AITAQQRKVFNVGGGLGLLAINKVREPDFPLWLPRHAKALRKWLACRPLVALLAREFTHSWVEQPRSLRVRLLACLCGSKVAIRQPLLEYGLRHVAVQLQPLRLLVLLVPAQPQ